MRKNSYLEDPLVELAVWALEELQAEVHFEVVAFEAGVACGACVAVDYVARIRDCESVVP